ncbi:MAG TPA: aldehyde dehydrogenase, partial [Spirochaetota bacterium]|nr:aldehyde dehydrogenase [Spirochaetota bacterium]
MGGVIEKILGDQRAFFNSGKTKDVYFRIEMLKKLRAAIKNREQQILSALHTDLRKSEFEGYLIEVGGVYEELHLHIKNVKRWAKPEKVGTGIKAFPGTSYIMREPYGVSL